MTLRLFTQRKQKEQHRKNWAALGQFVLESTFNLLLHNSNKGGVWEVRKELKAFQPGILNKEEYLEVMDGLRISER